MELTSSEHLVEFWQTVFAVRMRVKGAIYAGEGRWVARRNARLLLCGRNDLHRSIARDAILADESETMNPRDLHTRRFTSFTSGVAKCETSGGRSISSR